MLKRILRQCDGQDMVEYGMLIAVVALACVAALTDFSTIINTIWTTLTTNLSN